MKRLTFRTAKELDILYGNRASWIDLFIAYDEQIDLIEVINISMKYPQDSIMIKNPTEDMLIQIVKREPSLIEFLDNVSEKVYISAILADSSGALIQLIPPEKVTLAVALSAISVSPSAVLYLPDHIMSDDLIISSMKKFSKKHGDIISIMRDLPEKYHSEKVCFAAVKINALALYFCKCRTRKVVEYALKKQPVAIIFLEDGEYNIDDIIEIFNRSDDFPEFHRIVPSIIHKLNKLSKDINESIVINDPDIVHYIRDVNPNFLKNSKLLNDNDTWVQMSKNLTNLFNENKL